MSASAASILGLAACGGNNAAPDDANAADGKTYLVATDTTFAPFEFTNEAGEFVGIDVDLLAAIAADQGFTYELNSLGFDAAVAALESNQADAVIAGMSITPTRQESYDFTDSPRSAAPSRRAATSRASRTSPARRSPARPAPRASTGPSPSRTSTASRSPTSTRPT